MPMKLHSACALCIALLGGCSSIAVKDSAPPQPTDVSSIPDAVPRAEPRSKYGNRPSYKVNGTTYHVLKDAAGYNERGIASWYGKKFHGRRTSSGEPYDMYAMTAAHRSLPLPCYARVTNLQNGRSVVVKINDRGPFHGNSTYTIPHRPPHLPVYHRVYMSNLAHSRRLRTPSAWRTS